MDKGEPIGLAASGSAPAASSNKQAASRGGTNAKLFPTSPQRGGDGEWGNFCEVDASTYA
jgi:hypothetical protein